MAKFFPLTLLVILGICAPSTFAFERKVVCYFPNWSANYADQGMYSPEDVDPNLCTHIIYTFAWIDEDDRIMINDTRVDVDQDFYGRVVDLKRKNPDVKVQLAVGGWDMGGKRFCDMARNSNSRRGFITSTVNLLSRYGFDGLELSWLYPGDADRNGEKEDKENLNRLVKELQRRFRPKNWILSAAVAPTEQRVKRSYDRPYLCRQLDYVNLMNYDMHGPWEAKTGLHAPLNSFASDSTPKNNIHDTVNEWIDDGCDARKLVVGIPAYARTWDLRSESTAVGAPASPPFIIGEFTNTPGMLAYYEVCQRLDARWTENYHVGAQQAYAYSELDWFSFDTVKSVRAKAQFIYNTGLGGGALWNIAMDDFNGQFCRQGNYPLLTTLYSVLSPGQNVALPNKFVRSRRKLELPEIDRPEYVPVISHSPTYRTFDYPKRVYDPKQLPTSSDNLVVCYTMGGELWINNGRVDPNICTHIILSFSTVSSSGILRNPAGNTMRAAVAYHQTDPNVKVLLAVGGWNAGSADFSNMAKSRTTRKTFIDGTISVLTTYGFDGLDLDWEYPALRGGVPADKDNFDLLIQELQSAYRDYAARTRTPKLILSAAVNPTVGKTAVAYNMENICRDLDFVNLMTYDMFNNYASYSAPLYDMPSNAARDWNIHNSVHQWLEVCNPKKLIVGIPLYGRMYSSRTPITVGTTGSWIVATPSYNLICRDGWNLQYDADYAQAYGSKFEPNDNHYKWIGYDSIQSVIDKAAYIKAYGLGGAMVWSLDHDDHTGHLCGQGRYPMMTALSRELRGSSSVPPSSPARTTDRIPVTRTTSVRTTPSAPSGSCLPQSRCRRTNNGQRYKNSCDRTKYYVCSSGKFLLMPCPGGLVFNEGLSRCTWP